jgi:hypothetical protein
MPVRKTRKQEKIPVPGASQCHPRVGNRNPPGGCFPTEVLLRGLPKEGGAGKTGSRKAPKNRKALLKRVAEHLGVKPTDQRTLLHNLPLSDEEKRDLAAKWLRPAMPEGWRDDPDMWLDSNNIRDVMNQYEEAYPEFEFLGPFPIDFAARDPYNENVTSKAGDQCLIGEMCSLDLEDLARRGKEKVGIVYNLDPHYKNGSHWVANYIDIPKKVCYYFDSYGMKPPRQIDRFMQWLSIQEPKIKLGFNGRRFQKSDSECGMYCMYFLDRMLEGDNFLRFCRRAPPDRYMLDFRDWMFST